MPQTLDSTARSQSLVKSSMSIPSPAHHRIVANRDYLARGSHFRRHSALNILCPHPECTRTLAVICLHHSRLPHLTSLVSPALESAKSVRKLETPTADSWNSSQASGATPFLLPSASKAHTKHRTVARYATTRHPRQPEDTLSALLMPDLEFDIAHSPTID